jgi:hypothetical protein
MKQGQKYPIRQVSITNMTNFLNLLAGKTYRSKEIVELSKEHHIRANFLSYAKQISYCKKQADGSYYFLDRLFDPIHGKLLIETSNKYNNEVNAKKKLLKEKTHFQESITDELKEEENNNLEIENAPAKRERGRPAKLETIDETERVEEKPLESVSGIWGNIFTSKEHKLAKDKVIELTHQNKCLLDEMETMSACIKSLKNNKDNDYRINLIQQYEGELDFSQRQTRDLVEEKKQLQEENDSLKENIKHLKYIIYNAKEVDKSHEKNNEKSLLIRELLCQYLMDDCEVSTEINNKQQLEKKTNFNPFDAPVIERAYTKEFYTDEE